MGARAQVHIADTGVYLYTHWGARDLSDTIRSVLGRRARWDDPEYLTRMIFSAMIPASEANRENGYGIGTVQQYGIDLLITLNCGEETITVTDAEGQSVESTFDRFVGTHGQGVI